MDERDFCYWLQGYFEINNSSELTPTQLDIVKDHLQLVFNKVTPDRSEVGQVVVGNDIQGYTHASCSMASDITMESPRYGFG